MNVYVYRCLKLSICIKDENGEIMFNGTPSEINNLTGIVLHNNKTTTTVSGEINGETIPNIKINDIRKLSYSTDGIYYINTNNELYGLSSMLFNNNFLYTEPGENKFSLIAENVFDITRTNDSLAVSTNGEVFVLTDNSKSRFLEYSIDIFKNYYPNIYKHARGWVKLAIVDDLKAKLNLSGNVYINSYISESGKVVNIMISISPDKYSIEYLIFTLFNTITDDKSMKSMLKSTVHNYYVAKKVKDLGLVFKTKIFDKTIDMCRFILSRHKIISPEELDTICKAVNNPDVQLYGHCKLFVANV